MLTKERWDVMSFAETFKALLDPVRREILILLKKGTLSAGEIGSHFDMTGAMILSILVYTFFSRMFDLMLPPVAKHSIVVA